MRRKQKDVGVSDKSRGHIPLSTKPELRPPPPVNRGSIRQHPSFGLHAHRRNLFFGFLFLCIFGGLRCFIPCTPKDHGGCEPAATTAGTGTAAL